MNKEGFPLKVESIEATMKVRTFKVPMVYIGTGSPPKYRPWLEWIRTRIFRMRPRWRFQHFGDLLPR